ncbi:MAG: glycosyltransferase family 2 protein [Planctomycetaceae bacterium]|nr:glycosyltransferase family 2 protein [Planctomycetaceae bacterium]
MPKHKFEIKIIVFSVPIVLSVAGTLVLGEWTIGTNDLHPMTDDLHPMTDDLYPMTDNNITLSVIIPVRNESQHIGEVLDRLLEQDYFAERFEILVVDGFSADNTREIVRQYAEQHSNIRLFENPKQVSSAARNIGIEQSRGNIVLIIDGHCLIENGAMFKNIESAFERSQADCLGRPQPLEMIGATTLQWAIAFARRSLLGHHPDSFIYSGQAQYSPAISVAVAYRKEVFERVGLFDETFDACEDVEMNHRIDKAKLRCYFDPAIAVHYVPRKTLTGLMFQMNRYGRGRVKLFRKHRETFSLKSFGLGFFVLGVIFGFVFCWFHPVLFYVYFSILGFYIFTVLAESVRITILNRRLGVLFFLPIVFAAIHFGFGFGILREFLGGAKKHHRGISNNSEFTKS